MAALRASSHRPGAPKNTYIASMKVSDAEFSKFIHPLTLIFRKEDSSTSLQATPSLPKPIGVRREAIYPLPAWDPATALRAGRGRSR
jgi:hypothetical protein